MKDLPNEIIMCEAFWGALEGIDRDLPGNAIEVGSGRMKALFDYMPAEDPWERPDHPRWKQYWMGLWGATIEAIAAAWGVSLQAVLEVSEIASSRSADTSASELMKFMDAKPDTIRNPRFSKSVNPVGGSDRSA